MAAVASRLFGGSTSGNLVFFMSLSMLLRAAIARFAQISAISVAIAGCGGSLGGELGGFAEQVDSDSAALVTRSGRWTTRPSDNHVFFVGEEIPFAFETKRKKRNRQFHFQNVTSTSEEASAVTTAWDGFGTFMFAPPSAGCWEAYGTFNNHRSDAIVRTETIKFTVTPAPDGAEPAVDPRLYGELELINPPKDVNLHVGERFNMLWASPNQDDIVLAVDAPKGATPMFIGPMLSLPRPDGRFERWVTMFASSAGEYKFRVSRDMSIGKESRAHDQALAHLAAGKALPTLDVTLVIEPAIDPPARKSLPLGLVQDEDITRSTVDAAPLGEALAAPAVMRNPTKKRPPVKTRLSIFDRLKSDPRRVERGAKYLELVNEDD